MKLIWYIVSFITIFLILINNPKSTNLGNQGNVLNSTRSTQQGLQLIIALNVSIFFFLTTLSVLFPSI